MQKFKTSITISSIESQLLKSLSNISNVTKKNNTIILTFTYQATSQSTGLRFIKEHLNCISPNLNIISID